MHSSILNGNQLASKTRITKTCKVKTRTKIFSIKNRQTWRTFRLSQVAQSSVLWKWLIIIAICCTLLHWSQSKNKSNQLLYCKAIHTQQETNPSSRCSQLKDPSTVSNSLHSVKEHSLITSPSFISVALKIENPIGMISEVSTNRGADTSKKLQ